MFRLTKRRKFILSSIFLSGGLLAIQLGAVSNRYLGIAILSLFTIPLTYWSLKEALKGPVWLTSWILPLLFTFGVGYFYFLLPSTIFTAIPIIILYLLGMYALFLSENIFAVAAIRTIQLFRSAWAASFFLSLLSSFLIFDIIFSFKLEFYWNALLVLLPSFLLFLHGGWTVNVEDKINKNIIVYSLLFSLWVGELALVISFWPTPITLSSLFLTSIVYILLGLTHAFLSNRLFKKTVREYLIVGLAVFVALFLYTTWG